MKAKIAGLLAQKILHRDGRLVTHWLSPEKPNLRQRISRYEQEFSAHPDRAWHQGVSPHVRQLVALAVNNWTGGGAHSPGAHFLMRAIRDLGLSKAEMPKNDVREFRVDHGFSTHKYELKKSHISHTEIDDDGEASNRKIPYREFLGGVARLYAHTQAHLPDRVDLYRGVSGAFAKAALGTGTITDRPLSSWTTSRNTACGFAVGVKTQGETDPVVLHRQVPKRQVFAPAGLTHESELIVIGKGIARPIARRRQIEWVHENASERSRGTPLTEVDL